MSRSAKKKTKIDRLNELFLDACAAGDADLAHSTAETLLDLMSVEEEVVEVPAVKAIVWNTDPAWMTFCADVLEKHVKSIAYKSTMDDDLREDCENEARIALYQIQLSNIRDYPKYQAGEITEAQWKARLFSYCKNAIRNAIFSYLESPKTGSWNIGRTTRVRLKDGRRVKVHNPARYVSLDELAGSGLQVNEHGEVTWSTFLAPNKKNEETGIGNIEEPELEWPMEDE